MGSIHRDYADAFKLEMGRIYTEEDGVAHGLGQKYSGITYSDKLYCSFLSKHGFFVPGVGFKFLR